MKTKTETPRRFVVMVTDKNGTKHVASTETAHWIEIDDYVPFGALVFCTEEAAARFIKDWEGFPSWCQPGTDYRVVEVTPKTEVIKKVVGYACKED